MCLTCYCFHRLNFSLVLLFLTFIKETIPSICAILAISEFAIFAVALFLQHYWKVGPILAQWPKTIIKYTTKRNTHDDKYRSIRSNFFFVVIVVVWIDNLRRVINIERFSTIWRWSLNGMSLQGCLNRFLRAYWFISIDLFTCNWLNMLEFMRVLILAVRRLTRTQNRFWLHVPNERTRRKQEKNTQNCASYVTAICMCCEAYKLINDK